MNLLKKIIKAMITPLKHIISKKSKNMGVKQEISLKKQVIISMYDMEIGGIERSLINMLESFDYDKYEVDLLVCRHIGDFMGLIPRQVNILPEMNQYTVFRKPIIQCLREGHLITSMIRVVSKFIAWTVARKRRLMEGSGFIQMQLVSKYSSFFLPSITKEYDLAISYAWPHDILANKVRAKKKIAWIHTDYSEVPIDHHMDLKVWSRFDNIASISADCTRAFLMKYPLLEDRIVQIENITSPEMILKMTCEHFSPEELDSNAFKIVSVGRLSYTKGFDMAIEALRILHDKGLKDIKWYVVGYGGIEDQLRQLIVKNDLDNSFVLLGKQSNPYPYIKACDLYVQPSRYEGKAVTVTEAQILGKPIIITNYPTAKSQIEDGKDGMICELSIDGIVQAVEELYTNQSLRHTVVNNIKDKDYRNHYELNKLYQIMI